jgi:LDH2 family malate/lactate/ureidoglycolate dehydrogenase
MVRVTATQSKRLAVGILKATGAPPDEAQLVADLLLRANLMGVDSHGIVRIPEYMPDIDGGKLKPGAPVSVMKQSATTALMDGGWNFGQVAAMKGMEVAMMKAQVHDIGMVGVINCNHVGRLADYVMAAADKGLIGIMAVKTSSLVAPYGGTKRILGPNPLGIAIPIEGGKPFVLDIATSASAAGKVNIRRLKGEKLPEGWLVDAGGKPTTDPNDLFSGGSLLPFGGYKGYGLCVAVDILGGALTGLGCGTGMGGGYGAFACGALIIAIKPDCFVPKEAFASHVKKLVEELKSSPPQQGMEILIAGEPEFREERRRLKEGFEVDETTWGKLTQLGKKFNVPSTR